MTDTSTPTTETLASRERLEQRLTALWAELTPEEQERVRAFVEGIRQARQARQ